MSLRKKNPTVRFNIWICRGSGLLVYSWLWTLCCKHNHWCCLEYLVTDW